MKEGIPYVRTILNVNISDSVAFLNIYEEDTVYDACKDVTYEGQDVSLSEEIQNVRNIRKDVGYRQNDEGDVHTNDNRDEGVYIRSNETDNKRDLRIAHINIQKDIYN